MLGVEYRQWCAGKKSNSQVWREELWSVVAANFDGVNIPTEADFKQPSWSHWMQSWEGTCRVSLHQSGQATANTGQAAGFQHHSLSKTGKLPSFEKSWYCFNFYSKIYPYLPNRIVHSTPIESLVFCKVHGSSQPIGILELECFFSPLKIYTMVGKTICLFRKQPTGCYRPVSEPPCPWRFGELLLAKESPQQTRGGSFTSGAPTVTALCQLSGCLVLWRIYDSRPYLTGNLLSLVSNGVGAREASFLNSPQPFPLWNPVSRVRQGKVQAQWGLVLLFFGGPSLRKSIQNYKYKVTRVREGACANEALFQTLISF